MCIYNALECIDLYMRGTHQKMELSSGGWAPGSTGFPH